MEPVSRRCLTARSRSAKGRGQPKAALAQRRRSDPARRARQTTSQLDAGQLPARAEALRQRRARTRRAGRHGSCSASQELLDDAHHPRGHADLRHARASATSRCSSPQALIAEHPHRAADVINEHPGRQPQLPAQPRVQPLVHDRHAAGLEARPRRHARHPRREVRRDQRPHAADAEALQDQHEP